MGGTLPTNINREYVTRGPEVMVEGKPQQKRVGIVIGNVTKSGKDTILNVGWSLCNYRQGDRFNLEDGTNIAIGRASNMHPSSLTFKVKSPPTNEQLMKGGVAHSAIRAISKLITSTLKENPEITHVRIYSKKTIVPRNGKPIW